MEQVIHINIEQNTQVDWKGGIIKIPRIFLKKFKNNIDMESFCTDKIEIKKKR